MRPIFIFLISQSILLPIIAGLVRYRRIDKSYQPFFILLLIGLLTEIISFVIIKRHRQNGFVVNIYILIEWVMIAWQFHVWGFLKHKSGIFWLLVFLVSLLWVAENFVFGRITDFSPYFRFFYFFLIVLLSTNKINFMITHDNRSLFRNPKFLICIGFLIYFIFMTLYYWAYQVSMYDKLQMSSTFIFLMVWINALTNSIYAMAFLLIPARVQFTLK